MKANLIKTDHVIDGKQIYAVELINERGTRVKIYNYGAIINEFVVVNAHGDEQDIVLGFDSFEGYISSAYLNNYPYLGAAIGRYANRVKDGKMVISGKSYQLPQNNAKDTLHGGEEGFDKKVWDILPTVDPSLTLEYVSVAGEEGFPGNLTVQLTFKLTEEDELVLDYKAHTDAATAINLTHHSYFNLSPTGGSIAKHQHRIAASHYLQQDDNYVVTGTLIPVVGTIHDFLGAKLIGSDWNSAEGYDQSYVLDKQYGELTLASETTEKSGGLKLSIYTTEPVAHFYTAKSLTVVNGKKGENYGPFEAFCIETQHHPNGINIPEFPSTVLFPGETYKQTTIYKIEHQ